MSRLPFAIALVAVAVVTTIGTSAAFLSAPRSCPAPARMTILRTLPGAVRI